MKKEKYYEVTRVMVYKFQVIAHSKEAALLLVQDPHTVTVKSEKIRVIK